jgi:osmoprotectant transport system permease protein
VFIDWSWVLAHTSLFWQDTIDHAELSVVPVLIGLATAVPIGALAVRRPRLAPFILGSTTLVYSVPAIALFAVLIDVTGLSSWTVILPLWLYSLSILVHGVVDGLHNVPEAVLQAADAMGFGSLRRMWSVELPVALPVVMGALRVAMVSSISLVAVGALIGDGALGQLFLDGYQVGFTTEILAGLVLIAALALVFDATLLVAQRLLAPWDEPRRSISAGWVARRSSRSVEAL